MATILVVDDSSFQRRMIKSLMVELGHDVIEGDNCAVGIEVADRNPDLDIIFLDLLMPEMDGFEALEQFQRQGCAIPRVVLSADVQQKSQERCRELGAVEVLSKPPDRERLKEVLATHAGNRKVTR